MVINRLTTGNTFQQWVLTTQRISTDLNHIVDGTIANVYSNTNIDVDNNLHVNGNVLVTGTFILDEIDFDDLRVEGNLSVNNTITATSGQFGNLTLTGNIVTLNVTTDLTVGGDLRLNRELNTEILNTSNLSVQGSIDLTTANATFYNVSVLSNTTVSEILTTIAGTSGTNLFTDKANVSLVNAGSVILTQNVATLNTTSNLYVGVDATVYGNIIVDGDSSFGSIPSINIGSANVTILTGDAVEQIYETINASTAAVTVASNISSFIAFAIGLG